MDGTSWRVSFRAFMITRISFSSFILSLSLLVSATGSCSSNGLNPIPSNADDIASYIAGMPVPDNSPLYKLTLKKDYIIYRQVMDKAWVTYKHNDLDNIVNWRKKHIPSGGHPAVFYPFSGPDTINPLVFFPNAREYIMVGLESPGLMPDPLAMSHEKAMLELRYLQISLHTLMKLNYFRTVEMQKELSEGGFNNIPCIMMFFIKRNGLEIVDVRRIIINADGDIQQATDHGEAKVNGIEVVFRGGDGSVPRKARFFRVDLSDKGLKASPFMKYIERQGRFVTFMKSAAYLPALGNFSSLRTFILTRSDYIVEDDSAIPLRYFDDKEWKLSLYGNYRVLPMFSKFYQADLGKTIKEKNGGPIDFCYGYGYTPRESHVITAERK